MATAAIDYTALAKQAGAIDSQPAPSTSASAPDYAALAKQAGAVSSTPPASSSSPVPPTTMENVVAGAKEAGGDIWGAVKAAPAGIWHAIENSGKGFLPPAPGDHISLLRATLPATTAFVSTMLPDAIKHPIDTYHTDLQQALPIVDAYEKARSSGKGIMDSLSAANETARGMGGMTGKIAQKLDDLKKNPTREGVRDLGDTAAALAAMYGLGKAGEALLPEAEDAAVATTTGTTTAPAATSPSIFQRINPFRKAAQAVTDISKIEPAVEARTAKAGLVPGAPGLSDTEANALNTQATLDAEAATRANVDTAIQDIANKHAQMHGIPAPAAGTAARDVLTANGDALVEAGKANYKILDSFTEGKFTNVQSALKNAQTELRMKAGTTEADLSDLQANVLREQMRLEELFDTAVKNGMPKDVADTARAQFRQGQATLDVANDVRMANRVRGAGVRTTDPNILENRWTARHDTGRLQQAFGEQGAQDVLTQLRAAREQAEFLESRPPTESHALREMIAKNTETGKFGTKTDWGGVRKDFSSLSDRAARFADVPKVEKFINDQKFYQNLRSAVKWAARAAGVGAAGEVGLKAMQ